MESRKKKSSLYLAAWFFVILSAAITYRLFDQTFKTFSAVGLVAILVNLIAFYAFSYTQTKGYTWKDGERMMVIVGGLTLAVPTAVIYAIIVSLLRGWQLPFDY